MTENKMEIVAGKCPIEAGGNCPLRPHGEWIVEKDVYCRCPFCNFKDVKYSNYCPDCGADMRPKPNQLRDCENCIHHSDNGCGVWECEFKRRSS